MVQTHVYRVIGKDRQGKEEIYASCLNKDRAFEYVYMADKGMMHGCGWHAKEYWVEEMSNKIQTNTLGYKETKW